MSEAPDHLPASDSSPSYYPQDPRLSAIGYPQSIPGAPYSPPIPQTAYQPFGAPNHGFPTNYPVPIPGTADPPSIPQTGYQSSGVPVPQGPSWPYAASAPQGSQGAPYYPPPPGPAMTGYPQEGYLYAPQGSQGSPYYPPPPGPPTAGYPPGGYAPPLGYGASPGSSGAPPASEDLPPSYEAAALPASEPAIVVYRDSMIRNPKSSSAVQKYPALDSDIEAIFACSKSNSKSASKADSRITTLITILTQLSPLKMEVVAHEFPSHPSNRKGITLQQFIENETSGDVQTCLLGLILGPVKYDAIKVQYAIKSVAVKLTILNEILLELTPQESTLLGYVYQQMYKARLMWPRPDMHHENLRLFRTIVHPQRRHIPDQNYDALRLAMDDVQTLHTMHRLQDHIPKVRFIPHVGSRFPSFYLYELAQQREKIFTEMLTGRTHQHLNLVCSMYLEKHNKPMSQVIRSSFEGDYRTALLFIIAGCDPNTEHPELDPRGIRDAKRIDETMAGIGMNKELLTMRVLRAHWSRPQMDGIIAAFPLYNDKHLELSDRVKAEKGGIMSTQGFKVL
ncbi:hypothetical protein K438DRAFT_2019965 [Mycena galopus ATCC 62051]|nr:hypothetical protein K438DRAFT_2019965 [Mycena galopus ATCC 62051]